MVTTAPSLNKILDVWMCGWARIQSVYTSMVRCDDVCTHNGVHCTRIQSTALRGTLLCIIAGHARRLAHTSTHTHPKTLVTLLTLHVCTCSMCAAMDSTQKPKTTMESLAHTKHKHIDFMWRVYSAQPHF